MRRTRRTEILNTAARFASRLTEPTQASLRTTLLVLSAMSAGVFVAGAPLPAQAGLLRMESNTIFATYRGQDLAMKEPLIEFFEARYDDQPKKLNMSTNFSVITGASEQNSKFELYTLDGSYEVVPDFMNVTFGRSFKIFSTIRPTVMDSVETEFFLIEKRLTAGAYAGIERKLEALGSPERRSNAYGGFATYRTSSFLPLTIGTRVAHFAFDDGKDANVASLSMNQPLSGRLSPELLASSEFDLDHSHLNRAEAGFDIYPTYRSTLGLRLLTYDLSTTGWSENSVFNLISQGQLNELTLRAGYQFESGFSVSLATSYDRYLLQKDHETQGQKVETGLGYGTDRYQINSFTYYLTSYGGNAIGEKIQASLKGLGQWELFSLIDYVRYEKVTSSKRSALNTQAGASRWFMNSLRLDTGGEFNNNNYDKDDYRFFARLTYLLWRET